MPGKGILIKGRALGPYAERAMVILAIDIITYLLWHPKNYLFFAGAGAVLLCLLPYVCRFRIEITPDLLRVETKMIGFVTKEAEAPLREVILLHPEFVAANRALYSRYLKNTDKYLSIQFGKVWDEPADFIAVNAYGRQINLTGGQRAFGQELWDKLRLAITEVAAKEEMVEA